MADATLDPKAQQVISTVKTAIDRVVSAEQNTEALLAQIKQGEAEVETQRKNTETKLKDEVGQVIEKLDEEAVTFLEEISGTGPT